MPGQNERRNAERVRIQNHRSALCPWCKGPVIRDDRLVEGELRRLIVCLSDECGWQTEMDMAAAITPE